MLSIENNKIMMEHYTELVSVTSSFVSVRFKGYQLHVKGEELKILALEATEIYMAGKLESIEFVYEK